MGICVLGLVGDCGSKSQTESTNIINDMQMTKNDFSQLNSNMSSVIAETITKKANSNAANIFQNQVIEFSGNVSEGDINFGYAPKGETGSGITQDASATMTFDGLNMDEVTTSAGLDFIKNAMTEIQNRTDNQTLVKMEAIAESETKTSAFTTAKAEAGAKTTNIANTTKINENTQNIQNILQTNLANKLTTETVQSCISQIFQSQSVSIKDNKSGKNINVAPINQKLGASMLAKCKNVSSAVSETLQKTLDTIGVKVVDEVINKSEADQSGNAGAKVENKGIIESITDGIAKILDSLLPYKYLGAAGVAAVLISSLLCCCLIVLIMILPMIKSN